MAHVHALFPTICLLSMFFLLFALVSLFLSLALFVCCLTILRMDGIVNAVAFRLVEAKRGFCDQICTLVRPHIIDWMRQAATGCAWPMQRQKRFGSVFGMVKCLHPHSLFGNSIERRQLLNMLVSEYFVQTSVMCRHVIDTWVVAMLRVLHQPDDPGRVAAICEMNTAQVLG